MGETDSADKFMVFWWCTSSILFLLKQWEEKVEIQIGQPQVIKGEKMKN
jgi:hypothetical protein